MIIIKSNEEIACMRESGRIAAQVMQKIGEAVRPGVTTMRLDKIAEKSIKDHGAQPSFKGYRGFPASICVSTNEEIVHGIPSPVKRLKTGDIVSIDLGVYKNGYHGDMARTFNVGGIDSEAQRLIDVTKNCFFEALNHCYSGKRLSEISAAVENTAHAAGFTVVHELVGHGIGKSLHEAPDVPNFYTKGSGIILKEGMTIAIEPMINYGKRDVEFLSDGWTVVTRDRKKSAHYENTVAILKKGPEVLTLL